MAAYIPGYINSMDVCGFGFTTQSAMFYQSQHAALDVHEGVTCDGCSANPLRGIRWRCQSCPDHDICNNCKKAGQFADHPFQIMSMTSTNNANAMANGGQVVPEGGVHWTTCRGCGANPIRGTLYACTQCPNFDVCDACNKKRIANPDLHPHRFDFFYMPRACNPPPTSVGGTGRFNASPPQNYHISSQQAQPQQQGQHGFAPPPQPYYGPPQKEQSTTGRIISWLNRHTEFE